MEEAPGLSFDYGRFQLVLEPADGGPGPRIVAEPPPPSERKRLANYRVPPVLELCRGCDQYVFPGTATCPHCGGEVSALAQAHAADLAEAEEAARELVALMKD